MKLEISMNKNLKTVILAGGKGTRLKEETEITPKPMVKIGNKPILMHIIENFCKQGFNKFIFCLGYKSESISNYFLTFIPLKILNMIHHLIKFWHLKKFQILN